MTNCKNCIELEKRIEQERKEAYESGQKEGFEIGLEQQFDKKDPPKWVTKKAIADFVERAKKEIEEHKVIFKDGKVPFCKVADDVIDLLTKLADE